MMISKELEEYRRLVGELEGQTWDPDRDTTELDKLWRKLTVEERRGEEPMLCNGLVMEAHCQRGGPSLTLVAGHMYLYHPDHVPVIEEVSFSERAAETHYTDAYTMVLRLTLKGPRRDLERAPLIGFAKAHSFEITFTHVPPRYVVLVHGQTGGDQVIIATSVEEADWVQKRVAYKKGRGGGPVVKRWGVWLTESKRWLTWDDGEDWVGTEWAAKEEVARLVDQKAEARRYEE
jgi:hypothetical protein